MSRSVILAVALLAAACSHQAAPVVDQTAVATAAAERKAVADTDGARRDATVAAAEQSQ